MLRGSYSAEDVLKISELGILLGEGIQAYKNRGWQESDSLVQEMIPYKGVFEEVLKNYIKSRDDSHKDGKAFCQRCLDELMRTGL